MAGPAQTQTTAPPAPAPAPAPQAAPPAQAPGQAPGNGALGAAADAGFVAKLGSGLRLAAEELESKDGVDLSKRPQPLPGVQLQKAKWSKPKKRLEVDAKLAVPHLEQADFSIHVKETGEPSFAKGKLSKKLEIPALGSPTVTLYLSEEGAFGGSVEIAPKDLTPKGLKNLTVTGGGTLTITAGRFSGKVDATLAWKGLGTGEAHFDFGEAGTVTGSGTVRITPPFLSEASANLVLDEGRNLTVEAASATLQMTEAKSPFPRLSLTGGTLTVGYMNGEPSGSLEGFAASYKGLADLTLSASIARGTFSGKGAIDLAVPGLNEAHGDVKVNNGVVSGRLVLGANAFPKALPVTKGQIIATLAENGRIGFAGTVGVTLGPAGTGQLAASYSETGDFAISATIDLTVPGLQTAQFTVSYANEDISGETRIAIDPGLIPGLAGNATVRYAQGLWSGETELQYSADNGKLSGTIRVTVAQAESGALQLGGSGSVTAQIAPRLSGTLTATILPEGGVDVSGQITVTEPLELFPKKRVDKELFKYSQNIPLWAILVAVIRVRAGVRAGIGPGVFRNITVEGSYTIGSEESDPSFSITGEMFIPAFVEAYVAFGAGLGLDVVLGELTGGIEAVGTAGLYGAISVVPELSYADGDWGIEGTATLAAGARLKLGLNAWAEIEALWITVWENEWKLAEWIWSVGPDLALQAHMTYKFGHPEPPEIEFKTSDIDTESLIQQALPKDGPGPSGAKEALKNKAEWKGKLKEQRQAPVPPALAAEADKGAGTPPAPAPKKGGKPAGPNPPAQAPAGAAPGAKPGEPPKTPQTEGDKAKAAGAAAQPDQSAKGALPPDQVPTAGKPRYPAGISLATLDEPPAPLPRTAEQEKEDVDAAARAVELAIAATEDSDALDDYFPKIKSRFRLVTLGYTGDFAKGFAIEGGINPHLKITKLAAETVSGVTIAGVSPSNKTKIIYDSGTVGGSSVGLRMTANPLGPEHPKGSEASGQSTLMDQLPTDSSVISETTSRFIRGHLLNYDLGGPGTDFNLFPITAQGNIDHYNQVEKTVKEWVNDRKLWVSYKVTVTASDVLIPLKRENLKTGTKYKAVDSVLDAEASILSLSATKLTTLAIRIQSRVPKSEYLSAGGGSDLEPEKYVEKKPDQALLDTAKADARDQPIEPLLVPKGRTAAKPIFEKDKFDALAAARVRWKAATWTKIAAVPGVGDRRKQALQNAYAEALGQQPGDRDLGNLSAEDLTQFRIVTGPSLWPLVLATLA